VPEQVRMDEVLDELSRIEAAGDVAGFTKRDIMQATGYTERSASCKLREWAVRGMVKHVGYRTAQRIDGVTCRIPVYQVVRTDDGQAQ
jgi:hypothetical protein